MHEIIRDIRIVSYKITKNNIKYRLKILTDTNINIFCWKTSDSFMRFYKCLKLQNYKIDSLNIYSNFMEQMSEYFILINIKNINRFLENILRNKQIKYGIIVHPDLIVFNNYKI